MSSVDKKLDCSVISIKPLHGHGFAIKYFRWYGVLWIQFFNGVPCGECSLGATKLFVKVRNFFENLLLLCICLLYTSPSPRD